MKSYKTQHVGSRKMHEELDELLAASASEGWSLHSLHSCGEHRGCIVIFEYDDANDETEDELENETEFTKPEPAQPSVWNLWNFGR